MLYVPAAPPREHDPFAYLVPGPHVEAVVVPLPVFVCTAHKLTSDQARKMLTGKLRAVIRAKAEPAATLLWDRAWVTHVVIGAA